MHRRYLDVGLEQNSFGRLAIDFTGGCAQNQCLVFLISEAVKHPVQVPDAPQIVAALGCALLML